MPEHVVEPPQGRGGDLALRNTQQHLEILNGRDPRRLYHPLVLISYLQMGIMRKRCMRDSDRQSGGTQDSTEVAEKKGEEKDSI